MQRLSESGNPGTELAAERVTFMPTTARTFPFFSAHLRHPQHIANLVARSSRRGFTLIELMVVVVVIAITAAIAMPGIMNRMKSNRAKMAAEQIAVMYRQARLRSIGRSAAILVRYDNGVVSVHEAIQGTTATAPECSRLPAVSCITPLTRWANANESQQLERRDFVNNNDFLLEVSDAVGANPAQLDVCFAPSGRAFIRDDPTDVFTPWTSPVRINVDRSDGVGFRRAVLVSPTGTAKVVAAGVPIP